MFHPDLLIRWVGLLALFAALTALPVAAAAGPYAAQVKDAQHVPLKAFKALDMDAIAREDAFNDALRQGPQRFAIGHAVDVDPARAGRWQSSRDGMAQWQLRVRADGAVHLNFGFSRFRLPKDARLMIYAIDGKQALGPYTQADELPHGQLWTPILEGDEALLELWVPEAQRKAVQLQLARVNQGYRGFGHRSKVCKSGSCNTDVACLGATDDWQDPVDAVGGYTIRGSGLCTGSLVNNTANDQRMLFATATHCGVRDDADAAAIVVYWRYESPTCRQPGSTASGTPLARPTTRTSAGLRFLAGTPDPFIEPSAVPGENSDWALVELATPPVDNDFDLYWAGWDRRPPPALCGPALSPSATQGLCASIHHPAGHEKRITFVDTPMPAGSIDAASGVHYTANWDQSPPILPGLPEPSSPLPPSVTEPGSSGSPLYNADRRLVGVLSGGASSCGAAPEDLNDEYGGLFHAWEGLGTAQTRMRDHLDPLASGELFIPGTAGCEAPDVSLTAASANGLDSIRAGQDVRLQATVSGGSAPYQFSWDVDGDGNTDRSVLGLDSLVSRYPQRGTVSARLRVTDATGCGRSAVATFEVGGPDLSGSFGVAQQLCGNGDNAFDPGERWRLPFSLSNGGDANTSVELLFGKLALGGASQGGPDAFGYTFQDSGDPLCGYQFVDLEGLVEPLELIPAGEGFPAEDDGISADLALGDFAFEAYGQLIDSVAMGTNGYLTTDPLASGGDFASTCGEDPNDDAQGFRSNVFHDDLITSGGLRHATFEVCPRPADVGAADQRCAVFQWSGMGQFSSGGMPVGNISFQAIVYPDSRQIVHQYRGTLNDGNGNGDISLYRGPGNPRLTYSCDTPVMLDQRAVCFFHPGNQPATADPAGLSLQTPLVEVGELDANASANAALDFAIGSDTACGSRYRLEHRGSLFAGGFQPGTANFEVELAAADSCEVVTTCAADPVAAVDLNDGAFFETGRPGNGLVSHVIPRGIPDAPAQLFGLWFTGDRDRQSSWLVIQGDLLDNQVSTPILRFTRDVASPQWSVSSQVVGEAEVLLAEPNRMIFAWRLDGPWHAESLQQLFVANGTQPGTPDRTGAWFWPPESGWGLTVDSFRQNNLEQDFTLVYLYDDQGQPRWSLIQAAAADEGVLPALLAEVHCPGCAWLDINPTLQAIGSVQRRFTSSTQGNFSIDLSLPAPLSGPWQRSNVPITIISLPRPQAPESQP